MGAPSLNAAGRPMRRAAKLANENKAWLNCVTSSFVTKHPWLQEDQIEEDEESDQRDIIMWRNRVSLRDQRIEAADREEAARLNIAGLWPEPEADSDGEDTQAASLSGDSTASAAQESEAAGLSWDEFEDAVSETGSDNDEVTNLSGPAQYTGPALTDWVSRRPSSEYTSQLEVTHLPTSSGTDEAYFLTDEVFVNRQSRPTPASSYCQGASTINPTPRVDSPPSQSHLNPSRSTISSVPPQSEASPEQATALRASPSPRPTTAQRTPPSRSRIPVRTPPQSRSSARFKTKPRKDYHGLHHRGRTHQ